MVSIDACGKHEIQVFDEALKLQLGWNDVVGIGKCVLLDATEGWNTETARLKYRSNYG